MRFKALNLPIGKNMIMRMVGLDYKKYQADVQLMGYQEGKSLAVTVLSKPRQVLLRTGQAVGLEVKLAEGQVQFDANIAYINESPFLYLLLDYPLGVNFQQQREYPRLLVDTPVEVIGHTDMGTTTSSIQGYMLDVSLGGARIVLEKELTAMVTKISIGVMLTSEGIERDLTLMAEIRKPAELSKDYPECGFAYGVEFISVELVDELFLRAYCLQEVNRGRALLC